MKKILLYSVVIIFSFSCSRTQPVKRDNWQKPDKIFKAMSSSEDKNKVFCEIGSGSGYFTFKAAALFKHVYASEISDKSIIELSSNLESAKVKNITVIKSKKDDPLFPKMKCDIIFMGLVYHHIENRVKYLQNLSQYLTVNGKIVNLDNVVDIKKYEGTGKRLPAKECRFSKEVFIEEAKLAKFSKIKEHKVLEIQYLIEVQ